MVRNSELSIAGGVYSGTHDNRSYLDKVCNKYHFRPDVHWVYASSEYIWISYEYESRTQTNN